MLPLAGALLGFLLLSVMATLPAAWVWSDWRLLLVPPTELLLLALLLAALPWRLGRGVALLLAVPLGLLLFANGERLAMLGVMGRPGNLLFDLDLLPSIFELLSGNFGRATALGLLVGGCLALFLAYLLAAGALRLLSWPCLPRTASLAGALTLGACYAAPTGTPALPSIFLRDSLQHVQEIAEAVRQRPLFVAAAEEDPFAAHPPAGLLQRLEGTDVLLLFLESYGRTAVEAPRYAAATAAALEGLEGVAARRGFATASGWLLSPTIGGQSWLAHATLGSGLWVDSQLRYDLLLRSGRRLLPSYFTAAGWESLLVMPQVTKPWPEATLLGFEKTLFQKDLGYRGRAYNWITMPDQFTLAAFERLRRKAGPRAIFAEIALISSHAPWTPIPPVLEDWDAIGDGSLFSTWAEAGEPPDELWKDEEKVRRQYGLSIEYVLRVLASYLEQQSGRPFLLLAVGDHEPAALVSGLASTRQVPMHVISSDPKLLQPFLQWGFVPGTQPDPKGKVESMERFRDWFLKAFSLEPAQVSGQGLPRTPAGT